MVERINEMTAAGVKKLQEELEYRRTVVVAEISERLKQAREFGDLSENSENDEAKAAQAENALRIAEIEEILKTAKVITETDISKTRVSLGSQVVLLDLTRNEEMSLQVVGAKEEDILQNLISNESPVGSAIIGHKKGDVVSVRTPLGMLDYRIIKITRPKVK